MREQGEESALAAMNYQGSGFMSRVFGRMFKVVDRPWKMFPLGLMFGLGFDTSSEVAVLGIASLHAVEGTSIWLILIFPVLFTGASFYILSLTRPLAKLCKPG